MHSHAPLPHVTQRLLRVVSSHEAFSRAPDFPFGSIEGASTVAAECSLGCRFYHIILFTVVEGLYQ